MSMDQSNPGHPPIAIVGGGNMAHAIYTGAVDAGMLDPSRVVVADPDASKRGRFANAVNSASAAMQWLSSMEREAPQVLLAVKPQVFPAVAEEIRDAFVSGGSVVVLSIIAGTTSDAIRAALGGTPRVVRIMPNTPAQVGHGMSAIAVGAGAVPGDEAFAVRLMEAVGQVVTLDESMMDAFTGFAGSGPAYVFYLAEALTRAGEAVGFDTASAERIAQAIVVGSARLLEEDGGPAADLRRAVTSPNGTTQAGTETLDRLGTLDAFVEAVRAARDRGRELSGS